MKRLSIINCVVATLFGVIASAFVGCGNGDSGGEKSSSQSNQETQVSQAGGTSAQATDTTAEQATSEQATDTTAGQAVEAKAPAPAQMELKGVWYGESVFDIDAYNARLNELEPAQAERLQDMVATFSTIIMAAEFRPDSAMELDMMITMKDGQQMRDRSVGTYAVLEKTPTGIKIETKEYRNQEQQPTTKVYAYQFIDADHFQFIPDSVSPDIREFSPRIVFQRVEQPLDDASVAEGDNGTVVR